ncbi:hypothetical protein [Vibrio parahaemolyticus]|uniref:Apea-like HEPN domain-containing protein n=1 Tax=Vibrio parahaemolyticus TaxID=670 RepID=A0AA46L0Y4_VIBPH|nr:hypothetical protein [Vibrio parahaemolyticus]TXN13577.1 hypothetical protein FVP01_23015 [Vibrio parahaemolyticus]
MARCISRYFIELEQEINLSFSLDNCIVQTVQSIDEEETNEFGYLMITIEFECKDYESLSDAPIFVRAKYLSILGVVSYLIDEPFDVFGSSSECKRIEDNWELSISNVFILDNVDKTDKLEEVLGWIQHAKPHEKALIFSLLDRWRKARFMEKDTEVSFLYNDEATLSYFHVLELLGDLCAKELAKKSKVMLEQFCLQYNQDILSLSQVASESEAVAKAKLLSSVLEKDISVYAKICFYLKKYELCEERTAYWIKNLIEARNNVAHGRKVFYEKAIFPVQPFFPLSTTELYPLVFLRILTAKVIAAYIGVSCYAEEWEDVLQHLNRGEQATKAYLNEANFQPPASLLQEYRSIVLGGINDLILSKKIKSTTCEDFYRYYLQLSDGREEFLQENTHGLIIMLEETNDAAFSELLVEAIIELNSTESISSIKFRDLIYYLDFHGFKTEKLKSLIASGRVR